MQLSKVQKATRGDLSVLERSRLRPGTATTPGRLTDTRGGRPPGTTAVPAPAAEVPADPQVMHALQQMFVQTTNRDFWAQVAQDPTADDTTRLLASMADITGFAALRQGREATAWAPE